jgi:hypothetical protein
MWKLITGLIPPQYKIAALAFLGIFILSLFGGWSYYCYQKGVSSEKTKQEALQVKLKEDAFKKGVESVKVNEKIVTIYKDRVITVEKEVVKYVNRVQEVVPDSYNINLPNGLVWLLDSSVQNGFSEGPSKPDGEASGAKADAPSDVNLREVSKIVLENYAICYANAAQLENLQTWIIEQEKIYTNTTKSPFWKRLLNK